MTGTDATTTVQRRRRSIARHAGAALAGLVLAPAGANAQAPAPPPCDPADRAQRPALVLRGLPAQIAPGPDIPFRVGRAAAGSTRAAYRGGASVATERPHETNLRTEYFLDGGDDRALGRGMPYWIRLRRGEAPATVTLAYTYADASLAIPALLAGADGVVHKGAPAGELYEALRLVARGRRVLPPLSRGLLDAAAERLDPADLPVLGMVLDETPRGEIARTLCLEPRALDGRIERMLDRLRVEVPSGAQA